MAGSPVRLEVPVQLQHLASDGLVLRYVSGSTAYGGRLLVTPSRASPVASSNTPSSMRLRALARSSRSMVASLSILTRVGKSSKRFAKSKKPLARSSLRQAEASDLHRCPVHAWRLASSPQCLGQLNTKSRLGTVCVLNIILSSRTLR